MLCRRVQPVASMIWRLEIFLMKTLVPSAERTRSSGRLPTSTRLPAGSMSCDVGSTLAPLASEFTNMGGASTITGSGFWERGIGLTTVGVGLEFWVGEPRTRKKRRAPGTEKVRLRLVTGLPTFCQLLLKGSAAACTWNGAVPPVQFMKTLEPEG